MRSSDGRLIRTAQHSCSNHTSAIVGVACSTSSIIEPIRMAGRISPFCGAVNDGRYASATYQTSQFARATSVTCHDEFHAESAKHAEKTSKEAAADAFRVLALRASTRSRDPQMQATPDPRLFAS